MRTCYAPAPLQGRSYASRVYWVPELQDHVVVIMYDLEAINHLLANPATAHLPGEMCEAVQNVELPPPGPRLRIAS